MANPFHDENGRFCSRGEMLGAVHKLAASGKVKEYLRLKSEFDEADKGNVAISRTVLKTILDRSAIDLEVPEGNEAIEELESEEKRLEAYRTADPYHLYDMFQEETDKAFIKKALENLPEASHFESMSGVTNHKLLSFEEKLELVQKYSPSSLYQLVGEYRKEIFSIPARRKLVQAQMENLSQVIKEGVDGADVRYMQNKYGNAYAMTAHNSPQLDFVAHHADYSQAYNQRPSSTILKSNLLMRRTAITVLENELNSPSGNYSAARVDLTRVLANKGVTVPKQSGDIVAPLQGLPSEEAKAQRKEILKKIRNAKKERNVDYQLVQKLENQADAITDIYEKNYSQLKHIVENRKDSMRQSDWEKANNRYKKAQTRLQEFKDYAYFKNIVNENI